MRRWMGMLLAAVLMIAASCALADDYGKATIDAPSGKLHLREEPTSESDSLGLFFTGTQVTLKSDPDEDWVDVKIGRMRGYMNARYLKRGKAADRVSQSFWLGEVTAPNYARLRAGPSTEYQMYCAVNNGEKVTIMGETDDGWYYVKYKEEKGFISGNLVYTSGRSSSSSQSSSVVSKPVYTPVPTEAPVQGWKAAYRAYILDNFHELMTFALIYVDHDDIPELVIDTGSEAGGCVILTWHDGLLDALQTRRRGFTYRERENKLCNSDGHMGYYYDYVYEIRGGRWALIAYGEYDNPEAWDEQSQRYVCNHYVFNGKTLTEEAYLGALDSVYMRIGSDWVSDPVDLGGIITLLRE